MAVSSFKKRSGWIVAGLVLSLVLVLAFLPDPLQVDLGRVEVGPMQVTLDHEGKTRIQNRFIISAPVDGHFTRIEIEPGDPVQAAATLLTRIQAGPPSLLDQRSLTQAEAEVREAQSRLLLAQAESERARSASQLANREQKRFLELVPTGFVSGLEADRVKTEAETAQSSLDSAVAAVQTAGHQLEAAQIRASTPIVSTNESDQGQIEIYSPVDGIVLRRIRQSTSAVRAGEPLLEIGNPEDLEVVADFLSTDAVQMTPGMKVFIHQWGGSEKLLGSIRRVEPSGFLKISALGVEEQRVDVVILFETPYQAWKELGDEYRVEVQVVVWESESVIKVPTNALFREGDGWATFVVENGRVAKQQVVIGHRNPLEAEVLEGLRAGTQVIAHPAEAIEPGVSVVPR